MLVFPINRGPTISGCWGTSRNYLLFLEGDGSSKNLAFVDAVALKNVESTIISIRGNSAALRDLESTKAIKIVGIYNPETAVVDFLA
jgi:hypothetical protein